MTSAIGVIAEQVRQRVRREGVDLHGDRELAARYVRDEVQRYAELALGGPVPLLDDEQHVARQLAAALTPSPRCRFASWLPSTQGVTA